MAFGLIQAVAIIIVTSTPRDKIGDHFEHEMQELDLDLPLIRNQECALVETKGALSQCVNSQGPLHSTAETSG